MVVVAVATNQLTRVLVDLVVVLDMEKLLVVPLNQVFQYLVHIQETIMDLLVRHTEVVMLVVEEVVLEVKEVPVLLE